MASEGPNNPGTAADDDSQGTKAWINVNNIFTDNGSYSQSPVSEDIAGWNMVDEYIRIIKGGTINGDNKATSTSLPDEVDVYWTYGADNDLWGVAWSDTDINSSDFGVAIAIDGRADSHYLRATNFGFSIPSGATIDGIKVEVELNGLVLDPTDAYIDHVRITVYYTAAAAPTTSINIEDSWKSIAALKINIGDAWKAIASAKINIGDAWKALDIT